MAASSSAPRQRTRRFFQISLRTLMLLFVLFPAAAWYWQLPHEVERIDQTAPPGYFAALAADWEDPTRPPRALPIEPYYRREVRTVRRGWKWGERIRHGPSTTFDRHGNKLRLETWREGVQHGPYREWHASGQALVHGEYVGGERHGAWNEWYPNGHKRAEEQYAQGLHSGTCRYYDWDGYLTEEREYESGKLTQRISYLRVGDHILFVRNHSYDADEQLRQVSTWNGDGSVELERSSFQGDYLHGPRLTWHPDGRPCGEGMWEHGRRQGTWSFWDESGKLQLTLEFDDGRLVSWLGDPDDGFPPIVPQGARVASGLEDKTELPFIATPLSEVIQYVYDKHKIPIGIDRRALAAEGLSPDQLLVTANWRSMSLDLGLYLVLRPLGLTWTYRHEQVWVTTREDARSWRNRTGLAKLKPPEDSAWAAALVTPATLTFTNTPLGDVLAFVAGKYDVEIHFGPDCREDETLVTCHFDRLTLGAALAVLFDQHGLTCRLEPDDVLVIWPVEADAAGSLRRTLYHGRNPVVQLHDYDVDQQIRQVSIRSLDRSLEWERITFEADGNRGQFVAWHRRGVKSIEGGWRQGRRDGIWTFWDESGDVQATLEFELGKLVACEGNPIGHYPRSFFQATPAAARIATALQELTELEFLETPLSEVLQYVRDRHKIPVGFDVRALAERRLGADQPLTCRWGSLSLDLSLYFLLRPKGLTWDYRYEHLWITTVEDTRIWKDRSGMSQLEPPQDSRWAAALDAATEVEFIESYLGEVLEYLSAKHGVAIQLHRDFGSGPSITCSMRDISLRSALAAILNRHDLTCELRPDDVLEIRWIE